MSLAILTLRRMQKVYPGALTKLSKTVLPSDEPVQRYMKTACTCLYSTHLNRYSLCATASNCQQRRRLWYLYAHNGPLVSTSNLKFTGTENRNNFKGSDRLGVCRKFSNTAELTAKRNRGSPTSNTAKKGADTEADDDDDDIDDEIEDDEDDNISRIVFEGDTNLPNNYKEMTAVLRSLRLDGVVAAGLKMARNKVDDLFLESKLKLNGERVLKKSKQMKAGDCVDLIVSLSDTEGATSTETVKRVRVVRVSDKPATSDKLRVSLRVWRSPVSL